MKPVLLFDVMGTLVYDPYLVEAPRHCGLSVEELHRVKDPTAWIDFESGVISEDEYFRRFYVDRRPFDGPGLKERYRRAYRWLNGMEELLAGLAAAGVEMHAFSNYPPWYRIIEDRLGLSRYLDWSFVSCQTGLRKPDSQAYREAAKSLGQPPEDCLFVDDRAINCAAAEAAGMAAESFSGSEELRRAFETRGLLPMTVVRQ